MFWIRDGGQCLLVYILLTPDQGQGLVANGWLRAQIIARNVTVFVSTLFFLRFVAVQGDVFVECKYVSNSPNSWPCVGLKEIESSEMKCAEIKVLYDYGIVSGIQFHRNASPAQGSKKMFQRLV